jgi:hypothetical protein
MPGKRRKKTDKKSLRFRLAEKGGRFSLTAFWFSVTMAISLSLVIAVTARFLISPEPDLVSGLTGIAAVLALPNAILAGAYTWGKKIDKQG